MIVPDLGRTRPGSPSTSFCIVRHGETIWNTRNQVQGQLDVPLSAAGRLQAFAVAERVCLMGFASIYASDLRRAWQTAAAVSRRMGQPIQTTPELRERHYGFFQGLTYGEALERYPEEVARHSERDQEFIPFGGENLIQFSGRVIRCFSELEAKHRGQSILVVTHGGVLDILNRHAMGRALSEQRNFCIPNAALNWIEVVDGRWIVTAWAECSHLAGTCGETLEIPFWPA